MGRYADQMKGKSKKSNEEAAAKLRKVTDRFKNDLADYARDPEEKERMLKEAEEMQGCTDKNERIRKLAEFGKKYGPKVAALAKKVVLPALLLVVLAGQSVTFAADKPWPVRMWDDLKAHSDLNLGDNLAFGVFQDFVYGHGLWGLKSSLWNYRFMHTEAGVAQRTDGTPPVNFTLGEAAYFRPLLKWARIPDDWAMIKELYVGPFGSYDMKQYWLVGVQAHLQFLGKEK